MSAYAVTHGTIRLLIEAARRRNPMDPHAGSLRWYHNGRSHEAGYYGDDERANEIGRMLAQENANSLNYRYPDDLNGMIPEGWLDYVHFNCNKELTPAQVFKAAHCYEYQACEHPGWAESEAHAFLYALLHRWEGRVHGYVDAKWGAPLSWEPVEVRS